MLLLKILTMVLLATAQLTVPANDGFFTETVDLLQGAQEEALENALLRIAESTGRYIVVVFLEDFYGDTPKEIAEEMQREWDLPADSVLLLLSYRDRKAYVQPGVEVVDFFEPSVREGIVERDIIPRMREGEYGKAVLDGVESVMKHLSGQYTAERYNTSHGVPKSIFIILLYSLVGLFALTWLLDTVIIFKMSRPYAFAGTLIGPILGVLLLEKYGLWLSIPPFLLLGAAGDVLVHRLYASCFPSSKRKKRRREKVW
jgi:uncharacterized membrane protein YgcG